MVGGSALPFPSSPVQKEEGLREEHGSFPRRSLRRGPRLIKPPRSPEKPAPCGITPLSRRWADRARPAARCRNGVSAETPAIEKGSSQGRQALTEGLWVSDRNGLPVTGNRLLRQTYNPSASHPLSTSPYTGEARGGGKKLAPHHFAGQRPKGIGPAALRCGAFVHFPPAESGQKGRRGAFVPKAKCPPGPPVRLL